VGAVTSSTSSEGEPDEGLEPLWTALQTRGVADAKRLLQRLRRLEQWAAGTDAADRFAWAPNYVAEVETLLVNTDCGAENEEDNWQLLADEYVKSGRGVVWGAFVWTL
jgi:hypothetical protein